MVPVLLITGFLGSGKTTLLNRLLEFRRRDSGAGKIALIVNEFGDVGVDGDLFPSGLTRQVELPGGCICCSLDEDLKKTLKELLESRDDLTLIVIETTGLAEPLPISWTLATPELADKVRLAAVVTVVDALEHETHQAVVPAVNAQVDYADILVVSKAEHWDVARRDQFECKLRQRNHMAPLVWRSVGEDERLWSVLCDPGLERLSVPSAPDTRKEGQTRGHHGVHSISVKITELLDFEELVERLESLPRNFLRIKGIAQVVDLSTGSAQPQWIAFHRVGARVSAEPVLPSHGRVVALGSDMNRASLVACIDGSVVTSKVQRDAE